MWVDEAKVGSVMTLVSATEMELGRLTPGAHRLTIRVDNTVPYANAWNTHACDQPNNTAGNWNGEKDVSVPVSTEFSTPSPLKKNN